MSIGPRIMVFAAGIVGVVAVGVSAQASHGTWNAAQAEQLHMASVFALLHAVALLATGTLTGLMRLSAWLLGLAGLCFMAGVGMFCGGMYLRIFFNMPVIFIPWGGTALMAGWGILAFAALKGRPKPI
ncbi:MAG: DUF423 domain-containing protein [Rickettsiales bacterium]|nr:DUF423 domain-containing protein [Rickettsiales bacterium]